MKRRVTYIFLSLFIGCGGQVEPDPGHTSDAVASWTCPAPANDPCELVTACRHIDYACSPDGETTCLGDAPAHCPWPIAKVYDCSCDGGR